MRKLKFNYRKLAEIRRIRGYNQSALATEIGLSRNSISLYEKGNTFPESETIHKLANALNVPATFFFKEDEDDFAISSPIFFRKFASSNLTHRLMAEGRTEWLAKIYSILSNYISFPSVNLPDFNKSPFLIEYSDSEIESIAEETRSYFGLGMNPIGNLINILEYKGIIFGKFSIANSLDAFSLWMNFRNCNVPFILIDQIKDSPTRTRFNCSHELGHLVLHKNLSLNLINDSIAFKRIEEQADAFASAFLMPKENIFSKVKPSFGIDDLMKLKKVWGASVQAIIMRANKLGIFNDNKKTYLFKKLNYLGLNRRDPIDDLIKTESPSLLKESINKLINEANYPIISEILESLCISVDDLIELIGLSDENLEINKVLKALSKNKPLLTLVQESND
ncbi:helix-turn-helix domain-containing protein [Leptospira meyeri]|nr:XRE family transcriptional regulator [Leptospira meyeri]